MANPRVRDTIATGYTYQGKLIRPALVALQNPPPVGAEIIAPEAVATIAAEVPKTVMEPEEPTLL
jgi:hypothetical protein